MKELKDNVFELVHKDGPHGDSCSTYDIKIGENVTLAEFFEHLNPREWGEVHLEIPYSKEVRVNRLDIEYNNGRITNMPYEAFLYINKVIKSGWASGGWSCMIYWIRFE